MRRLPAAAHAIILAGGEGRRLRALTRQIAGDDRPKQFCALVGTQTLLDATRRRAAMVAAPADTTIVVTRAHARFYAPLRADTASSFVVQPESRGTAPAILYALLRVAVAAPLAPAVLLPSDHHVSDDAVFMAAVQAALDVVRGRPDIITLLGIPPDTPEVEYGWIEPGEAVLGAWAADVYRVRRFIEKPAADVAVALRDSGGLWNSFVIVGCVPALLAAMRSAVPSLVETLTEAVPALGTAAEAPVIERLYRGLPAIDFSSAVLNRRPAGLTVIPVKGVQWSDLGHPARVAALRRC
jgi:mannose-1-phosphate guanylyltransferase